MGVVNGVILQMKNILVITALVCCLTSCDVVPDRLEKITGAHTEIERINTCNEIYAWKSINLRIMRDKVSVTSQEKLKPLIEQYDETAFTFIKLFEKYNSEEKTKAQRSFNKKFTQEEFQVIVKKYDTVLSAFCEEILEDIKNISP